jgi:PKD repeat protein
MRRLLQSLPLGILLLSLSLPSSHAADRLPRVMGGNEALTALGRELPAVAAEHQMNVEEFRRVLLEDRSARLDPSGRMFYVDDTPPVAPMDGANSSGAPAIEGLAPLDQTFLLHSKPGASKTIYLDFDGHLMSGTAWNNGYNGGADIVCPPWDIDGIPNEFSDTERTRIQQIWLRVAEDFAPFDVDVTTEYTGEAAITRSSSSDLNYGMRVLISPIASYFGNYGGIAYVGVFATVGDTYKPALVFPEKLGNSEKNIAEAASHEAGHTLGLSHDGATGVSYYQGQGSGDTGWAPIMGVGYYKNLVQWSKGEYPNANNTQDDLAIVSGYLPYRADDHGNTMASATVLPVGATISASGIIERNTDVDVLRFATGAGQVTLNLLGAERGPNLDILAELLDDAGNVIATNNPADYLTAGFVGNLAAGNYYVRVRGTGKGDLATGYSNYGSLGVYFLVGTVIDPSGTVPPVAAASATPATGDAPLNVQFSSAQSSDPDGSIVGHHWDFGDGTTSTAANPAHTYNAVGQYTVTLTVTDNSGLTDDTSLTVSVLVPNILPVAIASATPNSGYAPLTVTLSGANSYDTDGSIVSYAWNFGDGTTGSGATVQKTYTGAGNYTATLTVTDNRGATATSTVGIQSQPDPNAVVRVQSIGLAAVSVAGGKQVRATVKITNPAGTGISGATVTGKFSGAVSGSGTATTDASGNAVITSKKFKKGTVTFTVTGVSKSGFAYSPAQNVVNSATIAAADGR